MTEPEPTPAEIIDITIPALDCDGNPAKVGVVASLGELDGILVELHLPNTFENAELTVAAARELIAALTAAIDYMKPPHTATVTARTSDRDLYLTGDLVVRDAAGKTVLATPVATISPETLLAQQGWAVDGEWDSGSATVRKAA